MNPEPCTVSRVAINFDGGRARALVQLPKRKETKTMNYRDFNPNASCLPAEAYPYLWAALSTPSQIRPTLWSRCRAAFARLCAALPVIVAAAFLPLADPPTQQLQPLRVVFDGTAPAPRSLVWEQPEGIRPKTLPLAEGNPYCF